MQARQGSAGLSHMARHGQKVPVPEVPQCQNWLRTCVAFIDTCMMNNLDHEQWVSAVDSASGSSRGSSRIQFKRSQSTSTGKAVIPFPVDTVPWHRAESVWAVPHTGTHQVVASTRGMQHPTASHDWVHAASEAARQPAAEPCVCFHWMINLRVVWVKVADLWSVVVCPSPVHCTSHMASVMNMHAPRCLYSVINARN